MGRNRMRRLGSLLVAFAATTFAAACSSSAIDLRGGDGEWDGRDDVRGDYIVEEGAVDDGWTVDDAAPADATDDAALGDTGDVALTWAEEAGEWGLAWTEPGELASVSVAFARLDGGDLHVLEGPFLPHPVATTAFHPSLAYNAGYYALAWVEEVDPGYPTARYPVRLVTRGCPLP